MNPNNYIEVRRRCNVPCIKHYNAVACMSLDEEQGLLYSGSWDRTMKVWRISDSKCLESVNAHEDAINFIVVGFDGLVFTGSADGTVKERKKKTFSHGGVLRGHKLAMLCLATAGNLLLCESTDKSIYVWQNEGGSMHTCLSVLNGHTGSVKCLVVQDRNEDDDQTDEEWIVYSGSLVWITH
ncbi:hypothetical protein L1887_32480 [Cichorium endivia]|nr:hypothetical protein L1887_32480 [Cichorium endivia]